MWFKVSYGTAFVLLACLHASLVLARVPLCQICVSPDSSPAPEAADYPEPTPAPTPLSSQPEITGVLFDVTEHGAVADGGTESSSAFIKAWKAACDHPGNSTFYVPGGIFLLGPISFNGPCYNNWSPEIRIRGTLRALPMLKYFPSTAWIVFKNLRGINVVGTSNATIFDGQGAADAWKQSSCQKKSRCAKLVTSLDFIKISHGTIRNITLSNSKGFHLGIHDSEGIHVSNVTVRSPGDSPNTDGIHISRSSNINITASNIGVGDDCVSIGPGSTNLSISGIHCGPGHGISVGSLGKYENEDDVVGIDISGCTIQGTQNGVRVKTWPGAPPSSARNLTFRDITMVNVSNPIFIDQDYCPSHSCNTTEPSHVKLSNILMKNISGTYNTEQAVTLRCSAAVACEDLQLVNVSLTHVINGGGEKKEIRAPQRDARLIMKGSFIGLKIRDSDFNLGAKQPSYKKGN